MMILRAKTSHLFRSLALLPLLGFLAGTLLTMPTGAQEAQWIWWPEHRQERVPQGSCYFRKAVAVENVEAAQVMIAADDEYELYVNSSRVGAGRSAGRMETYNITPMLGRGRNIIAVQVNNRTGGTAAVAARVMVKERGGEWVSYSTDGSWKCSLRGLPFWNLPIFNDGLWSEAAAYGPLGSTPPWDRVESVAAEDTDQHERFDSGQEFQVERILWDDVTGSLIAMAFNEFGQILASREGGPLVIITDSDRDGTPNRVRIYCEEVKNCQGILPLNGDVYVTADGPQGTALYRLVDSDRDGKPEKVDALVKFKGEMGEHGPHGLTLGPDGKIYIVVGNHSSPEEGWSPSSPHHGYYEGDLVGPRYEDPGGHANGVKVPGGLIARCDIDGGNLELVCGGLRNAYDLTFNREGELFVHDSDMESDEGMTWYRPTRLYHVLPGSEFGWRSGWAKWPSYFVDCLPPILETGRGSPTGAVLYDHHMLPSRYHNTLFLADWSQGRILNVRLKREGSGYTAESDVFIQGQPLNVTDLAVGPDGWLYFCTGGRGTDGGVYRVKWRGSVPESVRNVGEGLTAVIRQPQPSAAFSRQNIAALKSELGSNWDPTMIGVAKSQKNPPEYRLRALHLMQLFGPIPTAEYLIELSRDSNEVVRAKAADMMGLHPGQGTRERLVEMLDDEDLFARREALEALARARQDAPVEKLAELLASDDRFEAWSARRLLEQMETDEWKPLLLATENHRLFSRGAIALLIAEPTKENALELLDRASILMDDFISDRNFIDLLRVIQVALAQGNVEPREVETLRAKLAEEYPSGHPIMNRELVRLVTYLQVASITDRYIAFLNSDAPAVEKIHLAMHVRFIPEGWTGAERMRLLEFYEYAQKLDGGASYPHYIRSAARDFALSLGADDALAVLAGGERFPSAALGVLYQLPQQLDLPTIELLTDLDSRLEREQGESVDRLRVGIVAVLARSGDESSMAYLRDVWAREPERRQTLAMGLAQNPGGENWPFLIESLGFLEAGACLEVLIKLASVEQRPEDAEAYRQAILRGLVLKDEGADKAIALLEHWTGESRGPAADWKSTLASWQEWYAATYPGRPPAELPQSAEDSPWDYAELVSYLTSEDGRTGSPEKGQKIFKKADCAKCHRLGDEGEPLGPDLTTVNKRFMRKEILEAILFPSHNISDQYASKIVVTVEGRSYTGIVAPGAGDKMVILQANGEKAEVPKDRIEEIAPSKTSAMPTGLLDKLTLQEIVDLFAYLTKSPAARPLAREPGDVAR